MRISVNRAEFLPILRESLEGNMPKEDVEANLRYYRDYFAQSEHSDKEVCEELGDPRLIAKSLIDAYMASKGSDANQYMDQARSEYSQTYGETYGHETENGISKLFRYLIIGAGIVVFMILLVFLLRFALVILVPIALIVIALKLIRGDF